MSRALALLELALLAFALALLTMPAFALALGTADVAQWPAAARAAFPFMGGAYFLGLGALEGAARFAGGRR